MEQADARRLAAGAALFGYAGVARKRAGGTPLIEPSVFKKRSYVSGVVFAMVFLGTMGGLTLTLTALLQLGLGYSPIHAGLTTAPYALGGFVGSAAGGILLARLGRTILQAGLVVKGAGVLALYVALHDSSLGTLDFVARCSSPGSGWGWCSCAVRHRARQRRGPRSQVGVGRPAGDAAARHARVARIRTLLFGLLGDGDCIGAAQATRSPS
jgi:hypothetical protein